MANIPIDSQNTNGVAKIFSKTQTGLQRYLAKQPRDFTKISTVVKTQTGLQRCWVCGCTLEECCHHWERGGPHASKGPYPTLLLVSGVENSAATLFDLQVEDGFMLTLKLVPTSVGCRSKNRFRSDASPKTRYPTYQAQTNIDRTGSLKTPMPIRWTIREAEIPKNRSLFEHPRNKHALSLLLAPSHRTIHLGHSQQGGWQ